MDASKMPPDLDVGASRPQFEEVLTCTIVNFWIAWGSFFKCEFLPDYMSCHTRIFKIIIRLLSYSVAGAVAGTQLCCAVDIHVYIKIRLYIDNISIMTHHLPRPVKLHVL